MLGEAGAGDRVGDGQVAPVEPLVDQPAKDALRIGHAKLLSSRSILNTVLLYQNVEPAITRQAARVPLAPPPRAGAGDAAAHARGRRPAAGGPRLRRDDDRRRRPGGGRGARDGLRRVREQAHAGRRARADGGQGRRSRPGGGAGRARRRSRPPPTSASRCACSPPTSSSGWSGSGRCSTRSPPPAEPELAELLARVDRDRLEGLRRFVAVLERGGPLRIGRRRRRPRRSGRSRARSCTGCSTARRGWSRERYRDWLADTLAAALLP